MKRSGAAFVGIDTAKLKNAVAVAEAGRDGEARYLGEFENTPDTVAKLIRKLAAATRSCMEAFAERCKPGNVLDVVEVPDAVDRFLGDGGLLRSNSRGISCGNAPSTPPRLFRRWRRSRCGMARPVESLEPSIGLKEAGEVSQMLCRMLTAAIGAVKIDGCRRSCATEWSVVMDMDPDPPSLRSHHLAERWITHRRRLAMGTCSSVHIRHWSPHFRNVLPRFCVTYKRRCTLFQ